MEKDANKKNDILSMEEVFISKIKNFVLDNLSCEDFSLERLSHEIGYSRSQIHRKLKKITGKSLTKFIREVRLEEAKSLLQARVGTVSEVSFMVGFGSPVYFSKCFNEYYGVTPGEVLNSNNNLHFKSGKKKKEARVKKRLIYLILFVFSVIILVSVIFRISSSQFLLISNNSTGSASSGLFAKDKIHKILICNFVAEDSSDTYNSWLNVGIRDAIFLELSQFNYLMPYKGGGGSKQASISASELYNCSHFLSGSFRKDDSNYIVRTNLHEAKTGIIIDSASYIDSDLLNLIDLISSNARRDIGVSSDNLLNYPDLPFYEIATKSIQAYRYYIIDYYSGHFRKGNFVNIVKALELDPTFALASFQYAYFCHDFLNALSNRTARKYIGHAISNCASLPLVMQYEIQALDYSIHKKFRDELSTMEMVHSIFPDNIQILEKLIQVYQKNLLFDKAIKMTKKLTRLDPDNFSYQSRLAKNYLLDNKINQGMRYLKKKIKSEPANRGALHIQKGMFHLYKGDLNKAEIEFYEACLMTPTAKFWEIMISHVEFARNNTNYDESLSKFIGRYRDDATESVYNYFMHNGHLLLKIDHRTVRANYMFSDTSLASDGGFFTSHFCFNNDGKIINCLQKSARYYPPFLTWKEDSLITNAEHLFKSESYPEALNAFRLAYRNNPEHYYLANYIKHLDFILDDSLKTKSSEFNSFPGKYIEPDEFARKLYQGKSIYTQNQFITEIFKENDKLICRNYNGMEYILLPISKNQFMNPSIYNQLLEFDRHGMKIIFNNGQEYYFEKISQDS